MKEVIKHMKKSDGADRFGLIAAAGVPRHEVMLPSAVAKTSTEDRQFLDARGPNGLDDKLVDGPSHHLPTAAIFTGLHLEPFEQYILAAVDRKHYYHRWMMTLARLRSSPVG